uniref:Uncharacterized protein n=1 Tax=Oryza brachyantha TaxID=4533 RepID=J3KYS1_ORYBR
MNELADNYEPWNNHHLKKKIHEANMPLKTLWNANINRDCYRMGWTLGDITGSLGYIHLSSYIQIKGLIMMNCMQSTPVAESLLVHTST